LGHRATDTESGLVVVIGAKWIGRSPQSAERAPEEQASGGRSCADAPLLEEGMQLHCQGGRHTNSAAGIEGDASEVAHCAWKEPAQDRSSSLGGRITTGDYSSLWPGSASSLSHSK
jgi:hypothetical protein